MPDVDEDLRAEAERVRDHPPPRSRPSANGSSPDPIDEILGAAANTDTEPPGLDPALKHCDWIPADPAALQVGLWVQREVGNGGLTFRWPVRIRAIEGIDGEIWVFVEGVLGGIPASDVRVPVPKASNARLGGNGADPGNSEEDTDPFEGLDDDDLDVDKAEDEPEPASVPGPDPAAVEALREKLRGLGYTDEEISKLEVPASLFDPKPKRLNLRSVADILRKGPPQPRQWLLGHAFCQEFLSGLFASSGVGKTVYRMCQALAMACGRKDEKGLGITGERIYRRCRVLFLCLEDSPEEVERRLHALCKHYGIDPDELEGWIWVDTPEDKLATTDRRGNRVQGDLADMIEAAVKERNIDVVILDPLVDSHEVDENTAADMNFVCKILPRWRSG